MVSVLIWCVVVAGIAMLALWAIRELGVPDPIHRVLRVVIVVVAILIIIGLVAGLFGVDVGMPKVVS